MVRFRVMSNKWHLVELEGRRITRGPIFPVGHCAAALLKDGVRLGSGLEWGGLLVRGASEESWRNHLKRMENHVRAVKASVGAVGVP